jgi:hypothetical protein
VPKRGLQPPPFLAPPGIFGLGFLLENLHLGLDGRDFSGMLLLGCFQSGLRPAHGLLAAFALLLPGGFFARPFTLAPLLLLFEGESGLSLRRFVERTGGGLLRFTALRLADGLRWSEAAKIGGQLSMLAEGSVGSDGAPENRARFRHGRGGDVRIVTFPRRALVRARPQ